MRAQDVRFGRQRHAPLAGRTRVIVSRPLESGFAVPWDAVHAEFLVDVGSADPLELILANEDRETARRFGLTE